MTFVDTIAGAFGRRRVRLADSDSLATFLDRQAAFISQKCVTEFCRVRTGVFWEKLFREAEFQDALLASTWASHAPVLAMVTEMVEGVLRAEAGPRDGELRERLVRIAADVRAALVLPELVDRAAWEAQGRLVEERLAHAALAAPRAVRHLPDPLAKDVFDRLPLHVSLLANDFDYIFNNLRMNLLRAHDDFTNDADVPALVKSLLD